MKEVEKQKECGDMETEYEKGINYRIEQLHRKFV